MQTTISWFGHDSFRLEGGNKVVYIDPYRLHDAKPDADLILVTHHHADHLDLRAIGQLSKDTTVVAGPKTVARQAPGLVEVEAGDEPELAGLKVRVLPAYNVNKFRRPGRPFHPRGVGVGYLVHLEGETIYHTGDSDLIPEMEGLQPDVALLPVSGRWVMTAEEAAEAVAAIRPKRAIPMHYGTLVGSFADAQRFAGLVGDRVVILSKTEAGPQAG